MALAPEGNARVQLAEELIRQARARSDESRAALLPNISAAFSDQGVTRNLEAYGIGLNLPTPGFIFPTLVGPFERSRCPGHRDPDGPEPGLGAPLSGCPGRDPPGRGREGERAG